jgi:TnpA family transposase
VSPLEADEEPLSLVQLRKLIDERLPRVDITDVLIEVDNWTSFSDAFQHVDAVGSRGKSLLTLIYACILTQACNLGFKQMATSADLPYRRLLWCNRWYLRDETLDKAVTTLVNYHHGLPLSSRWGGGVLSSSDGQRFPVSGDTRKARTQPRYFGYGKGVTAYSWTSDQLSQFGTKVIPSTVRDATYVLDEILDNETDLDIVEHTSDTAGYTELVFGLFGLLGLTFSPRIRDLADQQLYRPQAFNLDDISILTPHLNKLSNELQVIDNWDEMLRFALSLKKGYCTASLLISKLQAYPRQHPIMRAIQEYGRLEKTIHILRWYADPLTRKRISKQLNKGEALHWLRKVIAFGEYGKIPGKEDEALDQQFACLNLVTNAVVVFNTVHIARIAAELKSEGYEVRDEDLERIWPSRHGHINFLGKYFFDAQKMQKA